MRLRILVPSMVLADTPAQKITADGLHGSFTLLPRHVDFLAALVPGLLAYEPVDGQEAFAAVDGSWALARDLRAGEELSPGQNLLEAIVATIEGQIRDVSGQDPRPFLPFVGTLFLFIVLSNVLSIVPGYRPPTGSLSTTAALAICVFVAVPMFGIQQQGLRQYLRQYVQPSVVMLPFTVIGELSRTLALAVRLFGNVMSGTVIAALLLGVAPLFFPVVMQAFGLLIGVIQAYIFAILAMVYIASATRVQHEAAGTSKEGRRSHG